MSAVDYREDEMYDHLIREENFLLCFWHLNEQFVVRDKMIQLEYHLFSSG